MKKKPFSPGPDEGEGREGGYNSEDEYSHLGLNLTDEEWEQKDRRFEKTMRKKGDLLKTCSLGLLSSYL